MDSPLDVITSVQNTHLRIKDEDLAHQLEAGVENNVLDGTFRFFDRVSLSCFVIYLS